MGLQELLKEEWRICILASLQEAPGGTAYEGLLQQMIARYHHQHLDRDQIQEQLVWLRDAGLVRLTDNPSPARVTYTATITDKGVAVAKGQLRQPGVRQPEG